MPPTLASYLQNGCAQCGGTENLQRCSGCKVILYCGHDDQTAHFPIHKPKCQTINRVRRICEIEEKAIRDTPPSMIGLPANVFETAVGDFWGFPITREYMESRDMYLFVLSRVKTERSVQEQLHWMKEILRLCRGDNMGIRSAVPGAMLLLNRDQECYDFVKWWAVTRGDLVPGLNIKDADPFEDVGYLCGGNWLLDISQVAAVILLKVKIVLDLQDVDGTKGDFLAWHGLKLRSPIVSGRERLFRHDDHSVEIKLLTGQIHQLYWAVDKVNEHFWPRLLTVNEDDEIERPNMFMIGSPEQAQLALFQSYLSWVKTPGALRFIEELRNEG